MSVKRQGNLNPPRFDEVPEAWKAPLGPYHQAPPENGGAWWFVNPFTGAEPWKNVVIAPAADLPAGFLEVFGPRPRQTEALSLIERDALLVKQTRWDQDLKFFKGIGNPPNIILTQEALATYQNWGLGTPRFYEGRYGWAARFPDQKLVDPFETDVQFAANYPHLVIAQWQTLFLLSGGEIPGVKHPFVPPHLYEKEEE